MSMIFISSASYETQYLSFLFRICECKNNNLFSSDQMFLKKILKFFFANLNPSLNLNHPLLRFPV